MRQLDDYKVRLLLACLVTVMFLGVGRANADFTFGTPTRLPAPVNSPFDIDSTPCISSDGLELHFDSWREGSLLGPDGSRSEDIWVATRATTEDEWGAPVNLGPPVNSTYNEWGPSISADGLELYFCSVNRPGGHGLYDLWVATRATVSDPWGEPENLGPTINTSANDGSPCISADGLELFFTSERSGAHGYADLWVTTRATRDDPWSEPVNLGPEVNGGHGDGFPSISADGRWLFFSSGFGMGVYPSRPGGFGECDLWVTRRAQKDEPWGKPVNLGPTVNTANDESTPSISSDGSMLYFSFMIANSGWNNMDLFQAEVLPIVDFNCDGIVDSADVCIMVDHWGENYSICDIGPMPWGDGVVNVEDLRVLADYIGKPMDDPTLIAHWPLDETGGDIAYDSAGDNNGTVMGAALWQPDGGTVKGALEFDGTTFVVTGSVLNPADGPFSALAWVAGGAPGQVMIAQETGAKWLMLDPATGGLKTELRSNRRLAPVLCSETVITDGNWHRVGLVWDGSRRRLYVDDVLVAEDTQDGLAGSSGKMLIGCGKDMAPGSFWSGRIDDVRIYSRAVKP